MRGANGKRPLEGRHWVPQMLATVSLVGIAALVAAHATEPTLLPRNFSFVSGTLSESGVVLEDVQICGCWDGLNEQSQKKVKFRITNNTEDTWINLAGGPDSNVYLVVSYPDSFSPVVKMPEPAKGVREGFLPSTGTPPNGRVKIAEQNRNVVPPLIAASVLVSELGVEDGWTAWMLPANPNGVVQSDPTTDGMVTFPTMVGQDWLGPGDSYYDDHLGLGDWVFYLPLPPEVAWMASSATMPTAALESITTDKSYKILGVAVVDQDGRLLGFAPLPPETVWSDAANF